MHKYKRTRGAVSVFLVLILVPCIVVSSVFVDISRVFLGKNVAASSADLALNSLMTNYDYDLSDWYGLAASCQNIDDFYEISAEYFLRMLSSQGISDEEIVLISDYYANATNDDTIYDLLEMESLTDTGDIIQPISGADLTNAALLKDQVVEFMKYRAPIEITTGIIEKLKKGEESVKEASQAEENKPLVDDKCEYYEAEGELLAAAFNSYVAIFDYYSSARSNGMSNDKLKKYADDLTVYKNAYEDIHKVMISNLWNTSGLHQYTRVTAGLDTYSYDEKSTEVYSRTETKDGETLYYIDGAKITSLLNGLETAIADFNAVKTNYITASSSLMGNMPGTGASQANSIQWWLQMDRAVNASSGTNYTAQLSEKAAAMLNAYAKVLAIDSCELGNDIPGGWKTKSDNLKSNVRSLQSSYLTGNVTNDGDGYLKAVKALEKVSADNINAIHPSGVNVTIDGVSKTVESAVPYISGKLNEIRTELQEYVDLLDIAIDGNESDHSVPKNDRVKKLDKLVDLVNTYNKKKVDWSNTANRTNTDMGALDRAEIAGIEVLYEKINEASVRELKNRLINIRTQFQTVITAIDSMKYGSRKVLEINDYNSFKAQAGTRVSESGIGLTNQEIENYASSTFIQLFQPNIDKVMVLEHTSDTMYNPEINPETGSVRTPELFKFFHEKFKGLSKQEVTKNKDELDNGKNVGDDEAKKAKDKGRYTGGGTDIAKDFSTAENFNLVEGSISGCMGLIEALIELDVTDIRDDLYVTSYMMNMFSYATYENEGMYQLVEEKTDLTLKNYQGKYGNVKGSESRKGSWMSDALVDGYNKTLTNKMINQDNNAAYEAEIEYVLYGGRDGNGNSDNVKAVYNDIYGIRYTLNLVSGFKNFWNGSNTTANAIKAIATAIAGATGGIIPIPLTKAILIPILTIFETSKDLDRLEAGFPVELFKVDADDWWFSLPDMKTMGEFTSALSNPFEKHNEDKGLFYSDYLTLFVYLGLASDRSAKAMYERMAEVIQANIRKLSGENNYSMSKAKVYFELNAEIRVQPLMLSLPIFNEYENDLDTKTDWCTFKVSSVRGYK